MRNDATTGDLIISALQQRIGEIVSQYETQIAILRAQITQLMDKDVETKE
jgi:restriction endonuclease S subunit